MRVSVPENFQNSVVGRFLFLEKLFSAVDFSRSVSTSGFERLDVCRFHGARGGA
jgi:hypothetical protein